MKINTTPDNPVLMGGVVGVSEFKIRNSAKAFSILSNGLYSNKIRAILREIGCNAVDSHVAAGKADVPFDLHLPTRLAPYFSIRDYGTGLSHEQVVNIYTTYFESTKTDSNDYIGALGLGSKSPFSYTDNFTVTAIQNGIKGVYSAFINQEGVPSVALMTSTATDEPNGVEVMFAVEKDADILSFKNEATTVYRYFKVKPNLTGAKVDMDDVEYDELVPLPKAALRKDGGHPSGARAVMGNIAYPIRLDNQSQEINSVLQSPIDFFFEIGDVEFAASREGLSYDKATVAAIQARAREVLAALETVVEGKLGSIANVWERQAASQELRNIDLMKTATRRYMNNHKDLFPLIDWTHRGEYIGVDLMLDEIEEKYNVQVRVFERSGYGSAREVRPTYHHGTHNPVPCLGFEGLCGYYNERLLVNANSAAIIERIKYHLRTSRRDDGPKRLFVLQAADKTKPMLLTEFMDSIHNPPKTMFFEIDNLLKKPVRPRDASKRIDIMRSEWDQKREEVFWRPSAKPLAELDPNETYYYVALKGFEATGSNGRVIDIKKTHKRLLDSKLPGFQFLYGVRAGDLPTVQKMKNWVLLDEGIATALGTITPEQFYGLGVKKVDKREIFQYIKRYVNNLIDPASPLQDLLTRMNQPSTTGDITELCKEFAPSIDPLKLEEIALVEVKKAVARYPMLLLIQSRSYEDSEFKTIADYINLIDATQKVN